jgi:serine/threonine protein kinase
MKAAFTPGTTFATYRVESLLGRGGMGVVYLAHDPSLERPLALKLIAPELVQDEEFRARFLREPKLAASLDHPNVIPIYEAGEHDGQLYLAMRYVKGTDLRAELEREGKLSPERTIDILAQLAGALDASHDRGLVHRDVKPANVLLDEAGHPYSRTSASRSRLAVTRPTRARWSARSTTSRPSRSEARRSTAAPTATRSRACCTNA